METESRRKGVAKGLAFRVIGLEAFIHVSGQIKVRSGIRPLLYPDRSLFLNVFYHKARVLIIFAIKAINSDRPQKERCLRVA